MVGFVDKFDGDTAFVTVTADTGEIFYIDSVPADILKAKGIKERRRFTITLEPIPDVEISEEREREINRQLEGLGDEPNDS